MVALSGGMVSRASSAAACSGRQPCRDPVVHPPVNFGAQTVHQPVEGAERRQVDRGAPQRLDRPVDEVGGVAHGLGGLEHDAVTRTLPGFVIGRDSEMGAHRGLVAVESSSSAVLVGTRPSGPPDPSCAARCVTVPAWISSGAGKQPEILARLQQRRQHQAARVAAGGGAHEGMIRLAQTVPSVQFLARQPLPGRG